MLVLGSEGCAFPVGEFRDGWSGGAVRVDQEEPVRVWGEGTMVDSVGVQVLVDAGGPAFADACTVRGAWLTPAGRDTVLAHPDAGFFQAPFFGQLVFESLEPEGVQFGDGEIEVARLSLTPPSRPTTAGVAPRGLDETPNELRAHLFVDFWLEPGLLPVAGRSCRGIQPPAGDGSRAATLIDFGTSRPVEGSGYGVGVLVLAIIAATALVSAAGGA